jgi:hypothetical protein
MELLQLLHLEEPLAADLPRISASRAFRKMGSHQAGTPRCREKELLGNFEKPTEKSMSIFPVPEDNHKILCWL